VKTDDLIRALSRDTQPVAASVGRGAAIALALGIATAALVFWAMLGPRPDIASAAHDPRFLFKFVVTLALGVSAVALMLRLGRPGAEPRALSVAIWSGPALLALAVCYELFAVPSSQWMARLVGRNSTVCLLSIPTIAAPLLVAALAALRRGAPTQPALAGAVAGLAAGGLGAALYAAHCIDDSPLFVMAWYVPAIALVAGIGALAGERVLRW
jgi:hypothetical protein